MFESPEKRGHGYHPSVTGSGAAEMSGTHSDIFFAAIESTRMPMIVTDPHQADNPIIVANHAFTKMTGYANDEVIGRNCRFLQGPETDGVAVDALRRAIAERREFATEILNYRKDGSSFWNALFVSPVHNNQGELVYFFASQLDVSRRRDAEEALHQAQKMEALGQLTGGIAHDFNNLLQVISGYTDILQSLVESGAPDLGRLGRAGEAIRTATDRAATLTHQLLAFSRKQRLEGRTLSLNALVEGMSEIGDRTLGDDVELRCVLAPDLWNARIDPTQAEVALLNILVNARDAMPAGGRVTVETRNRVLQDRQTALLQGVQAGNYVEVSVSDTGTGMAPEVLLRVMEPFFTTKGEGKGTGLGLATVYGFAKQSGGTVRITSAVGGGTVVRLLFPATEAGVQREARPVSKVAERHGSETVLVVDDRPEVAETARIILEDFGYHVLVSHGPAAAIAILEDDARIDLLLSDLVMPGGMTGVGLARAARERQPKIKVLLTTGFAADALERPGTGGHGFPVIDKPYRRMELARRVRQVLDGPADIG
ncbi:histidine kinase famiy protein [Methylobacterium haplocladii]|uniref:histidine kinase n=1 Tax=Methylobacterium haplocladii TaxID=1176176 RepID=A0A512IQ43_9HYPH|nr:histidine kinase famiy protein [Methylobacterium haplocladii]GEO99836.1 hybrid sensor histidine kinase/response regulator [Methylobacterium haplocladii]GJD84812.1 Blue-light-activated protein [Methylobacterium haplocladii]GLS58000.1 hybrid sensor histidine kinase/response regulator [Methylobacterium haplocladii]